MVFAIVGKRSNRYATRPLYLNNGALIIKGITVNGFLRFSEFQLHSILGLVNIVCN